MGDAHKKTPATSEVGATLLEEGFARWRNELLGTLYFMLGNAEDARDVLQEAFLRCWRHREEVPGVVNLRAWVFRVTVNVGRDSLKTAWRRRRRPLPEDEAILVARRDHPESEVTRREEVALLRAALLDLRGEEQEVFLLRQNSDMTYEEIAQTLSIPVGTVKTRMRLALGKLRDVLGPNRAAGGNGD